MSDGNGDGGTYVPDEEDRALVQEIQDRADRLYEKLPDGHPVRGLLDAYAVLVRLYLSSAATAAVVGGALLFTCTGAFAIPCPCCFLEGVLHSEAPQVAFALVGLLDTVEEEVRLALPG